MGQDSRPARSSVGSRFSKRTLVVILGNGRDAPTRDARRGRHLL